MNKKFVCISCHKEIKSQLPQSIELKKCVLCREQEQHKKLLANN